MSCEAQAIPGTLLHHGENDNCIIPYMVKATLYIWWYVANLEVITARDRICEQGRRLLTENGISSSHFLPH